MLSRRAVVSFGLASAVLTASPDASADWDFQLASNLNGGWLRQTPTLSAKPISLSSREIGKGSIRSQGGVTFLGPAADLELTIDDRWRVPLVGGALYWPVGSYDATITSYDGSIARLRPWTSFRFDVLLPGVGRRWKHRRNMFGVALRSGVSAMSMHGSVAAGIDSGELDLGAVTFLLQAEVEACRRLDPVTRVCLQVAPRIYEHDFMNGLTFGLRVEWGQ